MQATFAGTAAIALLKLLDAAPPGTGETTVASGQCSYWTRQLTYRHRRTVPLLRRTPKTPRVEDVDDGSGDDSAQ